MQQIVSEIFGAIISTDLSLKIVRYRPQFYCIGLPIIGGLLNGFIATWSYLVDVTNLTIAIPLWCSAIAYFGCSVYNIVRREEHEKGNF